MVELLKMRLLRTGARSAPAEGGSIVDRARRLASRVVPMFSYNSREISPAEHRNSLIAIQWFVAIGASYLILLSQSWRVEAPLPMTLVFVCLVSAPLLQRLPVEYFAERRIESKLLIFNSLLVLSVIGLTQTAPWDLLLLFFFCVFIAATGENLMLSVIGCTLLSGVFLVFVTSDPADLTSVNPELFVRVPFMLGISVLYGHLANQVKREKKRIAQMKQAEELKRQLVCALAHDVKAPLSVILGHAELLAGSYGGRPDPLDQVVSLKCIRENIERIVRLVTGFLNVAKTMAPAAEAGRTAVDINAIIRDVMRQQTVTLRKKDLNTKLDLAEDLTPCRGDRDQLERVLWNLIDNAIKYTPHGGTVALTSRMDLDCVFVSVKDTGIGIPKEDLASLFLEFKRFKGSENVEGTGLGLFIIKAIVDAHNGAITVDSEESAGTTFTLRLPAHA